MPRVEPVPATPEGNAVTNSLLARVLGRCPDILNAFGGLDAAIRFHGRLPGDLYEAVRSATAEQIGCEYCSSLGQRERPDLGPEQVRTGLAVAFAQLVAEDPSGVTEDQFAVLREEFNDEEIVELVAFICMVAVAGQMFGAVMRLEATDPSEAAEYQRILVSQEEKRARSRTAVAAQGPGRP